MLVLNYCKLQVARILPIDLSEATTVHSLTFFELQLLQVSKQSLVFFLILDVK